MGAYLHCFDLSDTLKSFNFCSRKVIESLLATQLLLDDNKPNPRNAKIKDLINCRAVDVDGLSSPRMLIIYKASSYRNLERPLTQEEEIIVRKADMEIEFEKRRRDLNYGAPSRLSCLYIVENTFEGRIILQNMFVGFFNEPFVVEVDIMNNMELLSCDHRWLHQYYENPNDEFIVNYWSGIPFIENSPAWEYLLEGTIILTNADEDERIERHVANEFPVYYDQILLGRQRNQF